MKIGLAMTGGGARGAYQAGVLKRIGEIKAFSDKPIPFKILAASSAGAVNAASMAAGASDFGHCSKKIANLWSDLTIEDIFRTDLGSLIPLASRWVRDLSLGGLTGGGKANSLLDSTPLKGFLQRNIPFHKIQENIDAGHLHAISIAATDYNSGKTYLFTQRAPGGELWIKSRRIALDTELKVDHICASAAIPVVFPSVRVTTKYGTDYFGDGCLRMTTPLSPAIRLGAEKILAIGVRHKNPKLSSGDSEKNQAIVKAVEIESIVNANNNDNQEPPSIAQILGVTFNAIFLDHLDTDVEHLIRLNEIIRQGGLENQHLGSLKEPMKIVTPLAISPSEDIGRIAEQHSKKMPKAVKYLMAGLTTKKSSGSDLLSYLLFDTSFTTALVDLGYKDASARIDEIEHFLAPVAANAIVESKYNESSGVENKIPKIGSRIS